MIINNPKQGDILVYTDSVRQKAVNPNDLFVVVGTVVTVKNEDGTTYKKVGTGNIKKLSVVLSEHEDEISTLKMELNQEKTKNRKIIKELLNIVEVLVNQAVLTDLDMKNLKSIQEDIKNEK